MKIHSIIIAMLTLLSVLGCLVGAIWAVATVKPILLPITLLVMAAILSGFVYRDYKQFKASSKQ